LLLSFVHFCSLLFTSCESEIIESSNSDLQKSAGSGDSCNFQPYGLYFENGKSVDCENNMMHFPSWDAFDLAVETLEDQVDNHEDSFVIPNDHLSEDALNDLEESSGFISDQPLIDYENSHEFCSLRAIEAALEDAWLDSSDQPGWSFDDYQENAINVDPYEQTLFNPFNEIMICNDIYKFIETGVLIIDSTHPDAVAALTASNNGISPEELAITYGGNSEDPGALQYNEDLISGNCILKTRKSIGIDLAAKYKLRAIHQLDNKTINGPSLNKAKKYKAFTKNYHRKTNNSKWKKRRIKSSAGFDGRRHDVNDPILCGMLIDTDVTGRYKKRRRSSGKIKVVLVSGGAPDVGTETGELVSTHRQRTFNETISFE